MGESEDRVKLKHNHIAEEWSEAMSDNGYWIALKSGWKWDGDVIGADHTIHEDTKAEAYREGVLPCNCVDCKHDLSKNPAAAALGRIGGSSKSKAKTEAAKLNGKKGGRPKKKKSQ